VGVASAGRALVGLRRMGPLRLLASRCCFLRGCQTIVAKATLPSHLSGTRGSCGYGSIGCKLRRVHSLAEARGSVAHWELRRVLLRNLTRLWPSRPTPRTSAGSYSLPLVHMLSSTPAMARAVLRRAVDGCSPSSLVQYLHWLASGTAGKQAGHPQHGRKLGPTTCVEAKPKLVIGRPVHRALGWSGH
jgi:hypothetical protein